MSRGGLSLLTTALGRHITTRWRRTKEGVVESEVHANDYSFAHAAAAPVVGRAGIAGIEVGAVADTAQWLGARRLPWPCGSADRTVPQPDNLPRPNLGMLV